MSMNNITPAWTLRPPLSVGPITTYNPWDLTLGLQAKHVSFDHRIYAARSEDARRAYDRLLADVEANGLKHPIIIFDGHVLIGMRRLEIARILGFDTIAAYEIAEDVTKWDRYDIQRLEALKRNLYPDVDRWMG